MAVLHVISSFKKEKNDKHIIRTKIFAPSSHLLVQTNKRNTRKRCEMYMTYIDNLHEIFRGIIKYISEIFF